MSSSCPALDCIIPPYALFLFSGCTGDAAKDILHAKTVFHPDIADAMPILANEKQLGAFTDGNVRQLVKSTVETPLKTQEYTEDDESDADDADEDDCSDPEAFSSFALAHSPSGATSLVGIRDEAGHVPPAQNESAMDVDGSGAPLADTATLAASDSSVAMSTMANRNHRDDVPDENVLQPDDSDVDSLVDAMIVDDTTTGDNGELYTAAVAQVDVESVTLSALVQYPSVTTQYCFMVPPKEPKMDVGGSGAPLADTAAAATSTDDHPHTASLPACDGPTGAKATAPDMHGTDDHFLIPPAFPTRRAGKRAGSRDATGRAQKGAAPTPSSQLLMVKEFKRPNGEPLTLAALSTVRQKTEILRMPKTKLIFEILSGFLPLPTGSPEQALNDLRRRDGFNELLRKSNLTATMPDVVALLMYMKSEMCGKCIGESFFTLIASCMIGNGIFYCSARNNPTTHYLVLKAVYKAIIGKKPRKQPEMVHEG